MVGPWTNAERKGCRRAKLVADASRLAVRTDVVAGWNIYCDESCHLELDRQTHMVMGALACPTVRAREIADRIREIKVRHGASPTMELKWTKVSPGNVELYRECFDYFLRERELRFRALVIQKDKIDHAGHDQTHDDFYYKMYFLLLAHIALPSNAEQFIYLDIKDTRSEEKVRRLERLLRRRINNGPSTIRRVQQIQSKEVEQAQLADLLIGAINYANRGLTTSQAKLSLVSMLHYRTRLDLTKATPVRASKVNLFTIWQGEETEG